MFDDILVLNLLLVGQEYDWSSKPRFLSQSWNIYSYEISFLFLQGNGSVLSYALMEFYTSREP